MKTIIIGIVSAANLALSYAQSQPSATCETPASIACIYGLTPSVPGCPIKGTSIHPTGGWGAIALVDSLDYGCDQAKEDLNIFSTQYGLPLADFTCMYATDNNMPPTSCTSAVTACEEIALDIEWSHAMAPNAKIILVEAASASLPDRIKAVRKAKEAVYQAGGGIVSMSWSYDEFPEETAYDSEFIKDGVVFIASSGDYCAPARYPSSSPNVISAGGTSLVRNNAGNFIGEVSWRNTNIPKGVKFCGGSGGPSLYEPRPSYQNSVMKIVGKARGTPDIAFEADLRTGVCVYTRYHLPDPGWFQTGGTSLAAPALAGVINSANKRAHSTAEELSFIYNSAIKNYHSYWHDTLQGNNGYPMLTGYDFTTGLGTPLGYGGK